MSKHGVVVLSLLGSLACWCAGVPSSESCAVAATSVGLPTRPWTTLPASTSRLRVPSATIAWGSSAAELEEAAAACNREAGVTACSPQTFALELRNGPAEFVASFFLDRTEVSVRAYERCVRAGRCRPAQLDSAADNAEPRERESLPAVGLEQRDARSYCAFAAGRLPTEREFERAVRGPERRNYPWGHLFHAGRVNGGSWGAARTNAADGYAGLAPVDALGDGRSPEGIFQLLGNVEEWTSTEPGREDGAPPGPGAGLFVVRGGHFADPPTRLRGAARRVLPAQTRSVTLGFRCANSDSRARPRPAR